ncbi:MAG: AMP-binding protein [Candidatus Poseidoniaceae archaeon]|nr:AMP-binding protein [Candidatus Poseidoniaceae archaeon]|tara:strand:- start:1245 stop:3158 length:1914 start_codon:yes stop_codon:yes gene_type:complete
MAELKMAWERQPDDRQWEGPEGDDPRTLYQMLMTSVGRFGTEPCFGYIPGEGMARVHLDYNTFGELSTSVAKRLNDIGVEKGDRVALILDNSVQWAALSYGANAIGAAYTAMYTHQHGSEWAYILGDSTPALIAVANTTVLDKLVDNLPAEASAWPKCGVILLGDDAANKIPPKGIEIHSWTDFVAKGRSSENDFEIADDPFALNTLIYTSGTTGNPKGVMLTNWNTLSNILCVQSAFKIYVGDKNAAFLPWAHSFGSTFDLHWMIRCGVHINLISDLTKIADECIEIKPAVLLAVPRVWNKFYDRVNSQFEAATGVKKFLIGKAKKSAAKRIAKADVECDAVPAKGVFDKLYDKLVWSKVRARFGGNIRFCMSGAAALSPDVAEFIQMVGFSCYEGYGLTETSPLVSANGWSGPGTSKLRCVGRVANGVKVTIDTNAWDDPDRPDEGEIIVHGPNVMKGYWNNEEATKEVIMEPGVFRTGDLGKLTKDGYLSITGRVKSQFKLENGKYVSPAPLEENLKLSPLVEQAVLDGRNMLKTYLIVHPNMDALKSAMSAAGVDSSGSNADICGRKSTKDWLLGELKANNMKSPVWKGYEVAANLILDHEEWTTDNDMLTPSMKVKLRNLLKHHDGAIAEFS